MLPVEPSVHVEPFATHYTLTWKAGPLSQFLSAIRSLDCVTTTTRTVVDRSDIAGRQQVSLGDFEPTDSIQYIRVEPSAEWTASWERRTSPTVSVSGNPDPAVCRMLHCRTTDCEEWPTDAVDVVQDLSESIS